MDKAQPIRLLDVVFIGPVMAYGGWKLKGYGHPVMGYTLMILGGLTVWYNGKNYLAIRDREGV